MSKSSKSLGRVKKVAQETNETLVFLQGLKEDDFTRSVLLPLFSKLGYVDSVFHGGPYEDGKDFISFKHDAFDKLTVLVAQVKRFRPTRSAAKSRKWGEIVHQLQMAQSKSIPCKDGQSRKPTQVAFITPFILDVRLLQQQFEQIQLHDITIIDGAALYRQIQRTWPSLLADIGDVSGKIAATTEGALSNRELFESLKIADDVPFENIYSDLNFFVGRTETRELICSSIEAGPLPTELTWNEWLAVKANLIEVEKLVKFEVISTQIPEIETSYDEARTRHQSEYNVTIGEQLSRAQIALAARSNVLIGLLETMRKSALGSETALESAREDDSAALVTHLSALRDLIRGGSLEQVWATFDETPLSESDGDTLNEELLRFESATIEKDTVAKQYVPEPTIDFSLNCAKLCDYVTASVQWLRLTVAKINSEAGGRVDIRDFLKRVELLLSVVNRLVHTRTFGQEVFKLKQEKHYENRFSISAHEVFDTGMNIAVYGEAGAGKSTTLHIYVKRRLERARQSDQDALVFLPINRVMSAKAASGFDEERDLERQNHVIALLKCTLIYAGAQPSDSSVQEFLSWIKSRSRITFVIDGLDEAVSNNEWLLPAINGIPAAFANSQVIISSRDCIAEINSIDFLGVTLLPFTAQQLQRFIEGWNPATGRDLWKSIKDQQLVEVAKSPLLATIVCSLHENGIKIPANEPEVYRKYIALLCGQYDSFKRVKRTRTPQEFLERVARIIAFKMHAEHLREIDEATLNRMLIDTFQETVETDTLLLAIAELISPCNILKRVAKSRLIGFGHLRFQEYLASEEFVKNNRYSPLDYINSEWWKGVLYLYAFNTDLSELMSNMYRTGRNFAASSGVLARMIQARPVRERAALLNELEIWRDQELHDDINPLGDDALFENEPDWAYSLPMQDDEE